MIAACTLSLWVFPSFGTQGMGTLRQAFGHVDRRLFVDHGSGHRGELMLRAADDQVDAVILAPPR